MLLYSGMGTGHIKEMPLITTQLTFYHWIKLIIKIPFRWPKGDRGRGTGTAMVQESRDTSVRTFSMRHICIHMHECIMKIKFNSFSFVSWSSIWNLFFALMTIPNFIYQSNKTLSIWIFNSPSSDKLIAISKWNINHIWRTILIDSPFDVGHLDAVQS